MKEIFTEDELDIAKEIINIGLSKGADSMSFFTKDKVLIRSTNLRIMDIDSIGKLSQKDENEILYVLITEIKGEMGGVCYLIFSEHEVEELLKISLSKSILEDEEKFKVMSEAVLLEMDNIMVASVITQFSNFFKYKTYGDVPSLKKETIAELSETLILADKTANYILYFKSEFQNTGVDINPEFIWMLDDKYIDGVKQVAKDEKLSKEAKSK